MFDSVGGSALIADTSGAFFSVVAGNINNSGTAAFFATLDAGGQEIRSGNSVSTTLIADTTGDFDSFNTGSGINDAGVVSFWTMLDAGSTEVWTSDGTTSTLIASPGTGGSLAPIAHSINSDNTVAFVVKPIGGDQELRIGNSVGASTLITTGGTFTSGAAVIHDLDVVAFVRPAGLFTTLDLAQPVITTGEMLDGKIIAALDFAGALNNQNQVAFHVWFNDGSEAIYRATGIPEPSSLLLCSLAAAGLLGYDWRRRKRVA